MNDIEEVLLRHKHNLERQAELKQAGSIQQSPSAQKVLAGIKAVDGTKQAATYRQRLIDLGTDTIELAVLPRPGGELRVFVFPKGCIIGRIVDGYEVCSHDRELSVIVVRDKTSDSGLRFVRCRRAVKPSR